jgi:hypothetical protein
MARAILSAPSPGVHANNANTHPSSALSYPRSMLGPCRITLSCSDEPRTDLDITDFVYGRHPAPMISGRACGLRWETAPARVVLCRDGITFNEMISEVVDQTFYDDGPKTHQRLQNYEMSQMAGLKSLYDNVS